MTRVACQAVIGVSREVLVFVVHWHLGVYMTVQTIEDRVVAWIRMAVIACRPLAGVFTGIDGELVTEYGTRPARGRMTAFTGFRETSRNVIRISHRFIHRTVT